MTALAQIAPSAARGLAQQNAAKAVAARRVKQKAAFKTAYNKMARVNVELLAKQQLKAWNKINPAWTKNMPGKGSAAVKSIQGAKGVAGENFQAPSMPNPDVTAISGGTALHPRWGDAINTPEGAYFEAATPMVATKTVPASQVSSRAVANAVATAQAKSATVAKVAAQVAKQPQQAESGMGWLGWALAAGGAYLLLRN